jgi:parallel beta-helix repeat protein
MRRLISRILKANGIDGEIKMFGNKVSVTVMLLALLFTGTLTLVSEIKPVEAADETIYIRANGSIEPSDANITTSDYVTYTFNGTNYYPIVVERSNIIIDGNGFAVQGKRAYMSVGIYLYNLSNITIANVTVKDFSYGIKLNLTSSIAILESTFNNTAHNIWGSETTNTTIFGNYVTGGSGGLYFYRSFNDIISGNNITSNNNVGIQLTYAYNATISGNSISKNRNPAFYGYSVLMYGSSDIQIYGNNITEGYRGISLDQCNNTRVYQNNVATHNWYGISFYGCINNSLNNNLLNDNLYGLDVGGEELNHYLHSIDTSNLVNDKPIYYLINQHHLTINASAHPEVGYLALINSTNITVEGLNLTENAEGILLAYTNNTKIQNNNFTDNYYGICLDNSSNSTITGNSFQRNCYGVYLADSSNSTIYGNTLEENYENGVELYYSPNCAISNNAIRGGYDGIYAQYSSSIIISENNIAGATDSCIYLTESFENIVCANNLTDSYYAIDFSNVSRSIVCQNNMTYNGYGVYMYSDSNNNIINENNITNNECGFYLWSSNNNTIRRNNIANNTDSIYLDEAKNNTIYHNNFINNTNPISTYNSLNNIWDDGYPSGGNYWSDHVDVDADYDGISDEQYEIDTDNIDRYPLMGPINFFDAGTWNGTPHEIHIISNSTISNFQIHIDQKMINFNVTGLEFTNGFCRVTIPDAIVQELWQNNYTVLLNGEPCFFKNWTYVSNTYIYINYTHSEHEITIVPESPSLTIPLLLVALTTFAVIFKRKQKL